MRAAALLTLAAWLSACDSQPPATPAQVVGLLETAPPGPDAAARGQSLFYRHSCSNCHVTQGPARNAPRLANLYRTRVTLHDGTTIRRDRAYLARSILQSQAQIVPGYSQPMSVYRHLPAREVADLIAYLETFSPPEDE